MNNKKNKLRIIIILLSFGIIAVYKSILVAFLTGLVVAIVAPLAAIIITSIWAKKIHLEQV
jgi:hypothetical protein